MQETGLKRNTIDKFYTNQDAVKFCINLFKKHINISKNDLIVEPSAGNGSFIGEIKILVDNYYFFDIKPENKEIMKKDFLKTEKFNFQKKHCLGNPPFGRQSSLAIKFIKKACENYDTVSFILPKSFKKESMKKYFPVNFHLICEENMPENSYLIDDKKYNVETVFQIWIKKNENRILPPILEPINFKFVKKNENPDLSFRRVGINAGTISTEINDKSDQSHYFIKIEGDINIEKLKEMKFEHGNTVGPKSIGKQDLIREFNKLLS